MTASRLEDAIGRALDEPSEHLEDVVRQHLDRPALSLRRRALLAAICIPVVLAFGACGDDTRPPVTTIAEFDSTTGTPSVAASTGDAIGLTADVYEELVRGVDAMIASFTDSGTAQGTCADVAIGQGGITDCRRQIDAATATAAAASDAFFLSPFSNALHLAEGPCPSAVGDFRAAEHDYLQALRDWAADAATNDPAGDTFNAVTRIRGTQLPAAKDEVASACRPAPG